MKILVVDDEKALRVIVARTAQRIVQCEVITAKDGAEGLALLKEEKDFHILITDYEMPRMNGLQLIKEAKAEFPGLEIILMSGSLRKEDVPESAIFLGKPFNLSILLDSLKELSRLKDEPLFDLTKRNKIANLSYMFFRLVQSRRTLDCPPLLKLRWTKGGKCHENFGRG